MKKRDWIPFVSLGVFLGTMNLTIAGLGFSRIDRLETRMDRLEERIEDRLDDLDRRVSRIEGVLLLRAEEAGASPAANGDRAEPASGS